MTIQDRDDEIAESNEAAWIARNNSYIKVTDDRAAGRMKAAAEVLRTEARDAMFDELVQEIADLKLIVEVLAAGTQRKHAQPVIDQANDILQRARALQK